MVVKTTKAKTTKKGTIGKEGTHTEKAGVKQKTSATTDKKNASATYSQSAEASVGVEGSTGNKTLGASGSVTAKASIEQSAAASAGLEGNNVYAEVGAKNIAEVSINTTAEVHAGPISASVDGTAYAKTGISAETSTKVGDEGIKAEGELFAGNAAGVDGSGTVGVSGVSTTAGAGVSVGEQVGVGGGGEATFKNGVATVGVSGEVAVLVGAEVDLSVSVDTKKVEEDVKTATETTQQAAAETGNIITRTFKKLKFW
jgi:hypothetical protein